jgi:hypothetical protein
LITPAILGSDAKEIKLLKGYIQVLIRPQFKGIKADSGTL